MQPRLRRNDDVKRLSLRLTPTARLRPASLLSGAGSLVRSNIATSFASTFWSRALALAQKQVESIKPEQALLVVLLRSRLVVPEDAVCGSGNGSVTAFIARHKHPEQVSGGYIAEQGIEIGRDGEVHASWQRDGDALRVRIGGEAAVVASGKLFL